jgi:ribosomal-protein-alanine N-acetyltransferase
LAGYILTSVVSTKNGHVPQVAVAPDYQGHGLGTTLLARAIQTLSEMEYLGVSLSVTSANRRALSLYLKLGFQPLFSFDAFAWDNIRD